MARNYTNFFIAALLCTLLLAAIVILFNTYMKGYQLTVTGGYFAAMYALWHVNVPSDSAWEAHHAIARAKHYDHAVPIWERLAEKGHAKALEMLAHAHENGFGVERDVDAAIRYCQSALDQGSTTAKEYLTRLFALRQKDRDNADFQERLKAQDDAPKDAHCPNCGNSVPQRAASCGGCGALFTPGGWQPISYAKWIEANPPVKQFVNAAPTAVSPAPTPSVSAYSSLKQFFRHPQCRTAIRSGNVGLLLWLFGAFVVYGPAGKVIALFAMIFSVACYLLALVKFAALSETDRNHPK